MSCLSYHHGELYIENVNLNSIAEKYSTPCYIYSYHTLLSKWHAFNEGLSNIPHRVCYAVKANSNLAILHILAKLNSGFDIVSIGELERVLKAGGSPKQIIFSGVGKKENEIERAIEVGIYCFNVESFPELERLHQIASKLNRTINIALRINPNIDPRTHAYIATGLKENKFGIESDQVISLYQKIRSMQSLNLIGIACHLGSQITELGPFLSALDLMIEIIQQLRNEGHHLLHLNIGGGLGIAYKNENPPTIEKYIHALKDKIKNVSLELILEPGRALIAEAGVLLTRVEYIKKTPYQHFAIIDAGMNDLIRPALYHAWHDILPVTLRHEAKIKYDIVGPVCESADFLGKDRELSIHQGDLLAINNVGAYGLSMSSNYNSRCRPAEILVHQEATYLIRQRETIADLYSLDKIISI